LWAALVADPLAERRGQAPTLHAACGSERANR